MHAYYYVGRLTIAPQVQNCKLEMQTKAGCAFDRVGLIKFLESCICIVYLAIPYKVAIHICDIYVTSFTVAHRGQIELILIKVFLYCIARSYNS